MRKPKKAKRVKLKKRPSGAELRDAGMAQALRGQEDVSALYRAVGEEWFTKLPKDELFIGEDLRRGPCVGRVVPRSSNSWGGLFSGLIKTWLKAGRVVLDGWATMKDPRSHARSSKRYRKV